MLFVNALGGLALFLFGMKLMSRGLQKAAGEKMRTVLRFFSSNRLAGILEQALSNLIHNAIKYSGSPDIELSLSRDQDNAVISVTDHGCGIPEESQPRIFERFYRVHKERSRALGGTGLGLAIVKHIAQLHNGKAELHSVPGQGCCFKIIIPEAL